MTKALISEKASTNVPNIDVESIEKLKNQSSATSSYRFPVSLPSPIHVTPRIPHQPSLSQFKISTHSSSYIYDKFGRDAEPLVAEAFDAIIRRNNKLFATLINNGLNLNRQIFDNETLLHCAIESHNVEAAKLLINSGCSLNARTLNFQDSPLNLTIQEDQEEIFQLLIDKGANIEIENFEGETPLFTAIRFGNEKMVEKLISNNADVNKVNKNGNTPLHIAMMLHQEKIGKLLLKCGCDVKKGEGNSLRIAQQASQIDLAAAVRDKSPELAKDPIPSFFIGPLLLKEPLPIPESDILPLVTVKVDTEGLSEEKIADSVIVTKDDETQNIEQQKKEEQEIIQNQEKEEMKENVQIEEKETMKDDVIQKADNVENEQKVEQENKPDSSISKEEEIAKEETVQNPVQVENEQKVKQDNKPAPEVSNEKETNKEEVSNEKETNKEEISNEKETKKEEVSNEKEIKKEEVIQQPVQIENEQKKEDEKVIQDVKPTSSDSNDKEVQEQEIKKEEDAIVEKEAQKQEAASNNQTSAEIKQEEPETKQDIKNESAEIKQEEAKVTKENAQDEKVEGNDDGSKNQEIKKEEKVENEEFENKEQIKQDEDQKEEKEEIKQDQEVKQESLVQTLEETKQEDVNEIKHEEPKAKQESPRQKQEKQESPRQKQEEVKQESSSQKQEEVKQEMPDRIQKENQDEILQSQESSQLSQSVSQDSTLSQEDKKEKHRHHHHHHHRHRSNKENEEKENEKEKEKEKEVIVNDPPRSLSSFGNESSITAAKTQPIPTTKFSLQAENPSISSWKIPHTEISEEIKQLFSAIKSKNITQIRSLLDRRLDLNVYDDTNNTTPLTYAIDYGNLEIVKLITAAGANLDFGPRFTALHAAIRQKKQEIIDFLIQSGCDVNSLSSEHETPIYEAIRSGDLKLIQHLVSKGAEINVLNSNNMSPLYIAIGRRNIPIVKYLLGAGADPNGNGLPCLKLAQKSKDIQMINILTDSGAKQLARKQHKSRLQMIALSRTCPKKRAASRAENGSCMICNGKSNLLKLIPCGHVVVCKKCVDAFVDKYTSCPICSMGFYATALEKK